MATPADYRFVETPADKPQHVIMIDDFAALARDPGLADVREASIRASELTQSLLDAVWQAASG